MDEILQKYEIRKSNKEKTLFIEYIEKRLTDAGYEVEIEEKGLLGSGILSKTHKNEMKDKLLINFDCVGDGKTVVALAKKEVQEDALYKQFLDAMKEQSVNYDGEFQDANMKPLMFGSDQIYFKKGMGVCSLRKSPLGMYVARIHTPFDTICREENMEYISDGAVAFINKL